MTKTPVTSALGTAAVDAAAPGAASTLPDFPASPESALTSPHGLRPATNRGAHVLLRDVGRRFESPEGPVDAVRGLDLAVVPGEFCVIVGPSGCGKTTLLRIVAGLEHATSGRVEVEDPDGRRPVNAMVFQGRSLFPWLSLLGNVAYGLRLRGVGRRERESRARHWLRVVGLERFAKVFPHQVSEGMRQRVAIARALAVDPELLLMDEPFGALDEQNRLLLQEELLRIWEDTGKTVLFVTHSIDEALVLADRIVVMSAQPGTVRDQFVVPFPRPRTLASVRTDPAFAPTFNRIWSVLRQEVQHSRSAPKERS